MNRTHLKLTGLYAALVISALTLNGCVADDVMNDDNVHVASHSSDAYTLSDARSGRTHCGNWPEDLTETSDNMRYANHGCAVQNNIAMMIADPNTIKRPHPTDPPYGSDAANAVRNANSSKSSGSGGLLGALFGP